MKTKISTMVAQGLQDVVVLSLLSGLIGDQGLPCSVQLPGPSCSSSRTPCSFLLLGFAHGCLVLCWMAFSSLLVTGVLPAHSSGMGQLKFCSLETFPDPPDEVGITHCWAFVALCTILHLRAHP